MANLNNTAVDCLGDFQRVGKRTARKDIDFYASTGKVLHILGKAFSIPLQPGTAAPGRGHFPGYFLGHGITGSKG